MRQYDTWTRARICPEAEHDGVVRPRFWYFHLLCVLEMKTFISQSFLQSAVLFIVHWSVIRDELKAERRQKSDLVDELSTSDRFINWVSSFIFLRSGQNRTFFLDLWTERLFWKCSFLLCGRRANTLINRFTPPLSDDTTQNMIKNTFHHVYSITPPSHRNLIM